MPGSGEHAVGRTEVRLVEALALRPAREQLAVAAVEPPAAARDQLPADGAVHDVRFVPRVLELLPRAGHGSTASTSTPYWTRAASAETYPSATSSRTCSRSRPAGSPKPAPAGVR